MPRAIALFFGRVLTLDDQHRDAVDEKDHVLAGAVAAIVIVEFFGDLVDVAPVLRRPCQITIIDQRDIELAAVFDAKELVLVAQRGRENRGCRRCPNETAGTRRPAPPRLLCILD